MVETSSTVIYSDNTNYVAMYGLFKNEHAFRPKQQITNTSCEIDTVEIFRNPTF